MAIEAYRDDAGNLCILRELPPGKEPPTELVLFEAGLNETTKGDLLFDDEARRLTEAAYRDKGQEQLPWDYDHGMMNFLATPEGSKAAGWFTPDFSTGAMVAKDIEWTPAADKAIRAREYRFYSPAVRLADNNNDGAPPRVVRLVNAAVTNIPATKNQKPMVASDKHESPGKGTTKEDDNMSDLLKLLGAKTEAEAMVIVAEWNSFTPQLLTALDTKTMAEILPAITKLKAQATTAVELADKLRTIETERATEKRDLLIVELHDHGKLPESLHTWAKTMDYDSLRAFGDAAPKNPKYNASGKPDDDVVVLSDAEREVAHQLNMSPEDFIKAKKAEAGATKAHRAQYDRNARRAG